MIPILHLVTDDRVLALPRFESMARECLAAGGGELALHVRGPASGGRILWDRARTLQEPAREAGSLLLVNDRVDVALLLELDGIHLPERGFPVKLTRSLLPPGVQVGRSLHEPQELDPDERPDFVMAGTLFATPSHPGRVGAGPGRITRMRRALPDLPLIGIGGVTLDRIASIRAAGAHGIAVLRGVWDHPRPAQAVERYLKELERVEEP